MSLLDELNKEAQYKQDAAKRLEAQQRAHRAYHEAKLAPVMREAHLYLSAVVEKLEIATPDIEPIYPLDPENTGKGRGIKFRPLGYKYRVDEAASPSRITINCRCELDREVRVPVRSKLAAEQYAHLLNTYDVECHQKNQLDSVYEVVGATFLVGAH